MLQLGVIVILGKVLSFLDRTIEKLTSLATLLAGLFILATALMVAYEIIMRGLFNAPTEWSLEMSTYLVLAAGFLGLAAAYGESKHITVDILTTRLSARANNYLKIFAGLVCLAFCLVFLSESWDMAMTSYQLDRTSPSTLRVPLFIPQLSLPVGGFLLLLQILRKLILDLAGIVSNTNSRQMPQ